MKYELHIVTGAAGVGKSTFGKSLAAKCNAALLDSDTLSEAVVRAGMKAAGFDPTDRDSPEYKTIFRDAVYECLFATAAENLPFTPSRPSETTSVGQVCGYRFAKPTRISSEPS